MKTTYFKITKPENYWDEPIYIKIAEKQRAWLVGTMIDISYHDSHQDAVESITNNALPGEKVTVVTREEFDLYYKRFVERLNEMSVI